MYHNHNLEFNQYDDSDKIVLEMLCEAFFSRRARNHPRYLLGAMAEIPSGGYIILRPRPLHSSLRIFAYRKSNDLTMLPVASGNMNFEAILAACEDERPGTVWLNRMSATAATPSTALKDSYDS